MSRITLQRGTVSPRQLIVAVGLGAVLIWVVSHQLPEGDTAGPSSTASTSLPAATSRTRRSTTPPAAAAGPANSLPELTDGDFARIVRTNPFVTSHEDLLAPGDTSVTTESASTVVAEPPAPPLPSARQQAIAKLTDSSVRLFYSSSRGSVVLLDDRLLRTGDVVDDVARVKSISEDGIELELSPTTSGTEWTESARQRFVEWCRSRFLLRPSR